MSKLNDHIAALEAQAKVSTDAVTDLKSFQSANQVYAAELSRALGHPVGHTFDELLAAMKELPTASV